MAQPNDELRRHRERMDGLERRIDRLYEMLGCLGAIAESYASGDLDLGVADRYRP